MIVGCPMITTKYGYNVEDWEIAKEEMRQILIERASLRGMIRYSDLVSGIKIMRMEPDSFAQAHMLGKISEQRSPRNVRNLNQASALVRLLHTAGEEARSNSGEARLKRLIVIRRTAQAGTKRVASPPWGAVIRADRRRLRSERNVRRAIDRRE
jgi:hypothetical protein